VSIPLPKVFWPLVVSAANCNIPIRVAGVTYVAVIASATYYSAETFRAAVAAAVAVARPGMTVSSGLAFPGSLTFFYSGAFSLYWASAPTAIAAAICGFSSGVDVASIGNAVASAFQPPNAWYAPAAVAMDDRKKSREGDRVTVAMSGQSKRVQEIETSARTVAFQFVDLARTFKDSESGNRINASAERWWSEGAGRFRYWPDASAEGVFADYVLAQSSIVEWKPERMFSGLAVHRFTLEFLGFVS
jgi:hypothetical protein